MDRPVCLTTAIEQRIRTLSIEKNSDRLSYGYSLHVNIHGSELTKSDFLSCTLHELKADKCICCSFDTLISFKRPCSLVQMKVSFLRFFFSFLENCYFAFANILP